MKKTILTLTTLALISGSLFTNCDSSSNKVDEAKKELDKTTNEMQQAEAKYIEETELFKQETEKKILENDEQIANLKSHPKKTQKEIQQEYEMAIIELEKRNQFIKDQFNSFNDIGVVQWDAFSEQFNNDLDALIEAVKELQQDIDKNN